MHKTAYSPENRVFVLGIACPSSGMYDAVRLHLSLQIVPAAGVELVGLYLVTYRWW